MRIAVNARLLCEPSLRGWNRYATNLLRELNRQGIETLLYADRPPHPNHLNGLYDGAASDVRIAPEMRYAKWEQYWVPRQCRLDGVDLFHSPFNFGLPWWRSCPQVLTLHDAIAQLYPGNGLSWLDPFKPAIVLSRLRNWSSRLRANRIITVSEHSKKDLVEHLGIPAERVTVIYEAADTHFLKPVSEGARRRVRDLFKLAKPFVLYVGGWETRKNIPLLLGGFAAAGDLKSDLVLAGGKEGERVLFEKLGRALGIGDRIRLLGWVDDLDLPALYAESLCFVYPSEYEGFGLQLTEAMAVGCPTLAAAATSLPEILGDGGLTFELGDARALGELLRRVSLDDEFRKDLSKRAKLRSQDFSWRRTAAQTIGVYEELVELGKHEDRPPTKNAARRVDHA
jgi:glycosyltransferase involved in cell wall biosynthesis